MRRDLERLEREDFDLLIVGGGITGAAIARDAAMRGLRTALVEKKDFAHATSAANSKLIHGGLRYLRNFELSLVRESLRERRIWQRIAPHLVRPLRFLLPLYDAGAGARRMLGAGLMLYDLLAFDRGWLTDPDQRLPGHRWLAPGEALDDAPVLARAGLEGAFSYYDCQMYSPERLAFACVADAAAHDAAVANHLAAARFLLRDGRVTGARVRDAIGGTEFDIRAKLTVAALGPWADLFLEQALGRPMRHAITRSKGIHIVVPGLTNKVALAVAARAGHFFVLPWRGSTLVGTTDTAFDGMPDEVGVTEDDIAGLLATVNAELPEARLSRGDVLHAYAGLRPLVGSDGADTYRASRRAELVDHERQDALPGLVSAIGGKWTTSRHLAEHAVDLAVRRLDIPTDLCRTDTVPLPGGNIASVTALHDEARRIVPSAADSDHLAKQYGAELAKIVRIGGEEPALAEPLSPGAIELGACIAHAAREEMAMTLEDAVIRRTGLGQAGDPGKPALEAAARIMARELGWTEDRMRRETESLAQTFAARERAAA